MPELSRKENYLRAMRHEEYEYVPGAWGQDLMDCAFGGLSLEYGRAENNFVDGFGVRWVKTDSTSGQPLPAPGEFILKDIARWKKDIAIPDVETVNWEQFAEEAMTGIDADSYATSFSSVNGVWERIAALMGFEEAMVALFEEPEACYDLFTAITDYKIKLAEKVAKHLKADIFINYDDIATQRDLFMSPDTYRRLIKPHHRRLNDAVRNLGMIPVQHTCGHAEICVDDYIETGAEAWDTVQPCNDITKLLDRYGDRFCFVGGYDSNGKPGYPDATVEEIEAEVERCFREYGGKKGWIFNGAFFVASGDSKTVDAQVQAMLDTADRLRFAGTGQTAAR
jgi:hypothetical protein